MEIREYKAFCRNEIAKLYASVGWTAYTDDLAALERGFGQSLLVLAAYEGEELLGILRAVGDGETIVFIQDILVFPAYQRKGVGTALVREALDRYRHVRQIELATDDTPKTVAFYKALGFRPFSELGCCGFMRT
jgi:GNAT superfamily N-acetyltransferase